MPGQQRRTSKSELTILIRGAMRDAISPLIITWIEKQNRNKQTSCHDGAAGTINQSDSEIPDDSLLTGMLIMAKWFVDLPHTVYLCAYVPRVYMEPVSCLNYYLHQGGDILIWVCFSAKTTGRITSKCRWVGCGMHLGRTHIILVQTRIKGQIQGCSFFHFL